MITNKFWRIAMFAGLAVAANLFPAELNVKSVVLYKHGVGFFEREGELGPGEGARLDFKADEMNDVLKSLTVLVKSGAGVSGLRYDSSEPLKEKLAQFSITLDKQQAVSALLDQLKGAQLELRINEKPVLGLILGARLIPASRDASEKEQVTMLDENGVIRTYEVGWTTPMRFTDPKLQLQLKDYLKALTQARSSEKRSVYIDSIDAGRRQIGASYMIPTPIWKSSYRLIFNQSGDPMLEGWAIVDNTTDEDWTNVRLSLVSGRPISFISKLYEPKFIQRPVADLADEGPVAPVLYKPGMMSKAAPAPPPPPARVESPQFIKALRQPGALESDRLSTASVVEVSSVASTSEGRDLGELFEYSFSKPVTVKKSESAMLPFLQQKLAARKLLIYSNESSQYPMNAAELTNATGKTLDGGPITVYDGGGYAGEALVETVKNGDKRLISYGVDIGTRITTAFDSSAENLREVHLTNGVLTTRATFLETKTYTIKNVDAKPKTLIIEYPVRPGFKLLNQKPSETTSTSYRFEVKLAAGGESKFPVQEERLVLQTYSITNVDVLMMAIYIENKALSAQGRQSLQAILDRKKQIGQLEAQINQATQQLNEVSKDQERIRQNLTALNRVTGQQDQVQKYAKLLADQEGQLASLRDSQSDLRKKKATLETELGNLMRGMQF